MTREEGRPAGADLTAPVATDQEFLRQIVCEAIQQALEAEMTKALAPEPEERTEARLGYRAAHYPRMLITRVGESELRVPRDRDGRFPTELFERYQRFREGFGLRPARDVCPRSLHPRGKTITKSSAYKSFSVPALSQINKGSDESLC